MFHTLSWFVVVCLFACWSLAAWAVNGVAVWTLSTAGVWTGAVASAASGEQVLRLPEWLASGVPPAIVQAMTSLLTGLAPAVQSLLQAAPTLVSGLTVAIWVIWALGSALLIVLGAGLHLFIAGRRRRGGSSVPRPAQPVVA